ncbi:glutamate-5-semialdehyde dehydrogenase [Selenomonas sp. TAMA-11512]|uniref:glutamate-5-semialdehyde dehydrogenase n=1 Tax=Selenomonas sp. TAMA-11512 TaxID=3095337 RepID=UPI003089133B|nr:glutamate-5-semialdehyde dehydrogenase [Selenomonas sp. TAMA-11512]
MAIDDEVRRIAGEAKAAGRTLAAAAPERKNAALEQMADALIERAELILAANAEDMEKARKNPDMKHSYLDRLLLDENRIRQMAEGLRQAAKLPDPVGRVDFSEVRPNGLEIRRVRVPLGVIGIIYEARPNVTADAAGLCIKSGNAVVLRGGSDALSSNQAIVEILQAAIEKAGFPKECIGFLASADRSAVGVLLQARGLVDVIIPRGGAGLIRRVLEESAVPVIETGSGICHTYIDAGADHDIAIAVSLNAKTSRPSVCNAMETLLVHQDEVSILPALIRAMQEKGVEIRGCARTRTLVPEIGEATEEDWATEYDELILSVKVVEDIDAAIAHINRYNTQHSETIMTNDLKRAHRFQTEVEAAAVYVNASTRFTDGFEFGFGAEIGISTQKLHARGPMGLNELTTTKYLVYGEGQIRL